jgi:hypothetical protein
MGVSCDLSATPAPEQSACPGTRLALSEKDQLKKGHDHECFSVPVLDRLVSHSARSCAWNTRLCPGVGVAKRLQKML